MTDHDQLMVAAAVEDTVGVDGPLSMVEDRIEVALKFGTRNRLRAFKALLDEHKDHETFRTCDWVHTLEMGFACSCTGEEQEQRISVKSMRAALPEARAFADRFMAEYRHLRLRGNKAEKRRKRRANFKAKALLHRWLLKEQRWTLRGGGYFDVTGSDGRGYRIFSSMCNNVVVLPDGDSDQAVPQLFEPAAGHISLCVIGDYKAVGGWLPTYDLMLAQKVMLETDAPAFWKLAVVNRVQATDEDEPRLRHERIEMTNEDLENPEGWVRQQLEAAG